tara:strand:+ start:81 stop:1550 length:1470 start_codon:yes stop_codon:yes gene_type:complete
MFKDLREYIEFLKSKDDLVVIDELVDQDLEITEITDRIVKTDGPALYFPNVKNNDIPLLINIFGSKRRMCWALGVDDLNDLGDKVEQVLGMVSNPPTSLFDKFNALAKIAGVAKSQPKIISTKTRRAPCQEVVISGEDVDLNMFPVMKCWPDDAGRFITLPLVVTKDPETGIRNVGTYRMQIFDDKTTGMHWQTHKVGAQHYQDSNISGKQKLEAAVVIGSDPITTWAGSLPVPPNIDEFIVAGFLRGKPVELVKCQTIDVEVPANSEIILEGYLNLGELRTEGPFGDHTGYYSEADEYPVFHVTTITHRKDPIYLSTMVGTPPTEDYFMGLASTRLMLPALKMVLPEIVDISMPAEGIFHNLLIISIKKSYVGHAKKVMNAIWGLGLLMLTKTIVIVDSDVDLSDYSQVAWRVLSNIDPEKDILISEGPLDDLDHASNTPKYGSKVGIDATSKGKIDGRTRPWPSDIVMSNSIKELVDKKWSKYNINN